MALKYNFLAINTVNIFLIFGLVQFFFNSFKVVNISHVVWCPLLFLLQLVFHWLVHLTLLNLTTAIEGFVNRLNQQHNIFRGLILYYGSEQYENRLDKGPEEEEIVFLSVIVLSHPLSRWSMLGLSNPVLPDDFHEDHD